jgi:hypothetical protein
MPSISLHPLYKITPTLISITDTGLGQRSVADDIEAVSQKIEYWHQGPISPFQIMCRDGKGFSYQVHWDGKTASFFDEAQIRAL